MAIKLPDTIPLGTAVMVIAREHAKRLAADYPEGCRMGQARASVNTALVELGIDVSGDWLVLERLAQHKAWALAIIQGTWVEY